MVAHISAVCSLIDSFLIIEEILINAHPADEWTALAEPLLGLGAVGYGRPALYLDHAFVSVRAAAGLIPLIRIACLVRNSAGLSKSQSGSEIPAPSAAVAAAPEEKVGLGKVWIEGWVSLEDLQIGLNGCHSGKGNTRAALPLILYRRRPVVTGHVSPVPLSGIYGDRSRFCRKRSIPFRHLQDHRFLILRDH